jgi:3-oxoacyl-[acyl-carrier protein] reductase
MEDSPVNLGLDGRVALVTGASKGLGRAIAAELAAEGARVAMSSRSQERIEAAARDLDATPFVHDSGDLDAAPRLVEEVEGRLGPIDVLITNSGGPPAGLDPLGFARGQWESAYRDLVLGPLALVEAVVPGMRERGFGRVVSVLSNAHRSGLLAALKTISRDAARDGVTVNSVLPGLIATDRVIELSGSREAAEESAREQIPVGRLGRPEEFAAAVAFLCSERAAYVTGTTLLVDGGRSHAV